MFIRAYARKGYTLSLMIALVAGMLASAHAADPSGVYGLDVGKLAIKVQSPSLVKGVASLPNLKTLGDRTGLKGQVSFAAPSGQADNFSLILPALPLVGALSIPGTWSTGSSSGKFSVVMVTDDQIQQVVALLNQLAGRSDITAHVSKNTFTGKLVGSQVKATFALAIAVTVPPVTLTIAASGAIGGAYTGPIAMVPAAPVTVRDFLTGFVVDEVRDLTVQ